MHIPSGASQTIEILSFSEAMQAAPREPYDTERWLYVPPFYDEYRYILGTRGSNPLICIGINPSTARPGALDPTLKSVERIAANNGYDSFIMFNVYPQRATDPNEKRPYLIPAVLDLVALGEEFGAQWLTFGRRSKAGHPHHPLYLRADSTPEPFDVRAYCETIS